MSQLEQDVKALEDAEQAQREQERLAKMVSDKEFESRRNQHFVTNVQQRFSRLFENTETLFGDGNWVAFKFRNKDYFIVLAEHEVPYSDDMGSYISTEYYWVLRQKYQYNAFNQHVLTHQSGIEGKADWYPDVVKILKELSR